MCHKGGGMFCHGLDREELDEAEMDESVVNPIELDYENNGTNDNNDDEEDATGYTNSECASLQLIDEANVGPANAEEENDDTVTCVDVDVVDDDDSNKIDNNNAETEENDEAFYQRGEEALKRATILAKLQKMVEKVYI